jgi:uncharacterized protein YdhG (YjbR/CyaY superfamily)
MNTLFSSFAEYISFFPEAVQNLLMLLHSEIMYLAPNSTFSIAYGMPAYKREQ